MYQNVAEKYIIFCKGWGDNEDQYYPQSKGNTIKECVDNITDTDFDMEIQYYILDTETREIEKIRNTYTLFEKIVYNDEKMLYNNYDTSKLDRKFVKIVVSNKSDTFEFDRFIDRVQMQNVYDLKIAENFSEFVGSNIADETLEVDDTPKLMDDYIDAVDTDLDKFMIKRQMRELMNQAQAMETV